MHVFSCQILYYYYCMVALQGHFLVYGQGSEGYFVFVQQCFTLLS